MVLPTTPFVKALVRWATGKRLTNHLPKLSLITREFYRFLNMIYSLLPFFFRGNMTVGIEPATSLPFMISRPACGAIVKK